jgi:LmbE family N-acetylglucosaminyl deacetylase
MSKTFFRTQLCQLYSRAMLRNTRALGENDLGRSSIIFSPHQDDEILGCGGTIIRKKRMGVDVKIVFMADGRSSHSHLISEVELKGIRAREALEASKLLGLKKRDVMFLEFQEGKLRQYHDAAISKVEEILLKHQPQEIFIPYNKESHPDHFVTNRIVMSALKKYNRTVIIYEYPIWIWLQWPWSRLTFRRWELLTFLKNTLSTRVSLSLLRDFKCSVYIGDLLKHKRIVLEQYQSQMTQLIPNSRWLTLNDISNGEFLECFFQEHEIFRRTSYPIEN